VVFHVFGKDRLIFRDFSGQWTGMVENAPPTPRSRHSGAAGMPVLVSLTMLCLLAMLQFVLFLRGGDGPNRPSAGNGRAALISDSSGSASGNEPLPDSLPPLPPIESPSALQPLPPARTPLLEDPARPIPSPASAPTRPGTPVNDPAAITSDEVRDLVTDAIRLRRQGDMAGAVAKLESAISLSPGHPRVLFEAGLTYEGMGLADRALARFQDLVNLGPMLAGSLFEIAQRRLAEGAQMPGRNQTPADAVHIGDVRESISPPNPDGQQVILTIDLHALPGRPLRNDDLAVIVKFFDQTADGRVAASLAPPPSSRWLSLPVDWADPSIETLEVAHFLPTQADARGYFGYLIELYYQDVLMDVLARPRRLARYQVEDGPGDYPPGLDSLLGGGLPDSLDDLDFPMPQGFPTE